MSTFAKIEEDFKKALKSKDEETVSTLRLLKSVIKNKEIEKRGKLKEKELQDLIFKEIKKRKEARDIYEKAGRVELQEKENKEKEILEKYLPEQISEEELAQVIKEVILKVGASGPQDIGKVMSKLMPRLKGRVEGSVVSKKVQELLS